MEGLVKIGKFCGHIMVYDCLHRSIFAKCCFKRAKLRYKLIKTYLEVLLQWHAELKY